MNQIFNSLQSILDKTADGHKIKGLTFAIKTNSLNWIGSSGNLSNDSPFFIASTTKLFTTAIILNLVSKNDLQLDDSIAQYIDHPIIDGLHIFNNKSFADNITIKHLLAHTSGLPDYFQGKRNNGISLENEIKKGKDRPWTFEEAITMSKTMKPHFIPGFKNKAHYSDTNFQLLGKTIECITNKTFGENCQEIIIEPLALTNTYLYQSPADNRPQTLHYKENTLHIPKAMSSFGADGGIVATASDLLRFTEAFFDGTIFPKKHIAALQVWNRIFFPMKSGIGLHLFKLPWIMNPMGSLPDLIGHSGLSGTVAFHSPKENIFIAGTVNQVAHPDISFKTMIKLIQAIQKSNRKL